MKRVMNISEGGSVSKMAIVDTFTKLIFGQDSQYSDPELRIIEALRLVDANVTMDCHQEMGVYLRALGVREMIGLVSRVHDGMAQGLTLDGSEETSLSNPQLRGAH